jgi:hypothetical protein
MSNQKVKFFLFITWLFVHNAAIATEQMDAKSSDQNVRNVMLEGMHAAVAKYGKEGGLYNDPRFRLPMPDGFQKVEKMVRRFGGDKLADSFIHTLNKTAEKTLQRGSPIIMEYINTMPIENSQELASGSNDAISDYFVTQSQTDMVSKIIPVLNEVSEQQGLVKSLTNLLDKVRMVKLIHKVKVKMDKAILKAVIDVVAYSMKVKT